MYHSCSLRAAELDLGSNRSGEHAEVVDRVRGPVPRGEELQGGAPQWGGA